MNTILALAMNFLTYMWDRSYGKNSNSAEHFALLITCFVQYLRLTNLPTRTATEKERKDWMLGKLQWSQSSLSHFFTPL